MANEIKDKFAASATLTLTLASLADGSGRQTTMVNNETARYQDLLLFFKITVGTSPSAGSQVDFYGLRGDDHTANLRTDNAGASDAAITVNNAEHLASLRVTAGTSDAAYYVDFLFHRPGPTWGIAVVNNSGAALNSTEGNHLKRYVGLLPEVQ